MKGGYHGCALALFLSFAFYASFARSDCVVYVLQNANGTCPSNSTCTMSIQAAITTAMEMVASGNYSADNNCSVSKMTVGLLDPYYSSQDCNLEMNSTVGLDDFKLTSKLLDSSVINCTGQANYAIRFFSPNYEISITNIKFAEATTSGVSIQTPERRVTIENCRFVNNTGPTGAGLSAQLVNTTLNINGVTFDSNFATEGGGFWISVGGSASVNINNTKVKNNQAMGNGGGGFLIGTGRNPRVDVDDILAKNNEAKTGNGGGIYASSVNLFVQGSADFESNKAVNGGGIALVTIIDGQLEDLLVSDNEVTENGGGIYLYDTNVKIKNSKIEENKARMGGGIYIYQDSFWRDQQNHTSNSMLVDVDVTDNKAKSFGGGIYVNDSILQWIGSRFIDNAGESQDSDSSVYCTQFAEEKGYCSRCKCLGECDTCPDEGCSVNGDDCICLVESSLVKECNNFQLPSGSIPDGGNRGLALGLVFGLFVPLIAIGAFGGWVYMRWKKRQAYMALDHDEKSNTIHPL